MKCSFGPVWSPKYVTFVKNTQCNLGPFAYLQELVSTSDSWRSRDGLNTKVFAERTPPQGHTSHPAAAPILSVALSSFWLDLVSVLEWQLNTHSQLEILLQRKRHDVRKKHSPHLK